MSNPYIGEIRMFGGNFAPAGWAFCAGQLMPISENDALFTLIGTTYGGDGQETFALPDLQGRAPMHVGNSHVLGEKGGVEQVSLTVQQIPIHTHAAVVSIDPGTTLNPGGSLVSSSPSINWYIEGIDPDTALSQPTVAPVGGSQPHENMQPYLAISFIISLFGIFPQQS